MKKKNVITLACLVVFIFAVSGCGNNEDVSATSDTSTLSEDVKEESKAETRTEEDTEPEETTETEDETEEELEFGSSIAGANLSIGATKEYRYANNNVTGVFTITFEDAGVETVDNGSGGKTDVVYMVMEISNNTDRVVSIENEDFAIYMDNYQIDIDNGLFDSPLSVETGVYSTDSISVNAGRNGKFIFKSNLPEGHESISNIEIEFVATGDILAVKENGIWINDYMDYGYDGSVVDPYYIYGDQYKVDEEGVKLVISEGDDKSYYGNIIFGANQQAMATAKLMRRDDTIIEEGEVILDIYMINGKVVGDYEKVGELHLYVYVDSYTELELILDDHARNISNTKDLAPIFNGWYNMWGNTP